MALRSLVVALLFLGRARSASLEVALAGDDFTARRAAKAARSALRAPASALPPRAPWASRR